VEGKIVALVRDGRALDDDCRTAGIVIATLPVRGACPSASLVIDRFDLWRQGAHAVYLDGGRSHRVDNVRAWQGERPWTARPETSSRATRRSERRIETPR
jgi:competence protein ComEC